MTGAALRALGVAALCLGTPAFAQTDWQPLQSTETTPTRQRGPELASGSAATLHALDKMSGDVIELAMSVGAVTTYGRLSVTLVSCRYPVENPSSDAFAFLEIRDVASGEMQFRGWMIASSPALNALDNPRYDIWVTRCR
ncbi:DUF2155 domain-containing protein [Pararhodobacter sp.]|uniref:DUF2155 domain-containing protein n=1 Tax=Pararhodobacter sp. TaxID=2127056 RepID=UPI002AFFC95B|nr:DUF2155 domain-containing protein [Pararhodobacter sp.]